MVVGAGDRGWNHAHENLLTKSALGTSQYLLVYRTGKFAGTGPPVIFVPHLDGATAYFGVRFQRGQRLFWSTPVWGHELYLVFTGLFHSENTGPWQILSTGQKIISVGDFNWGTENFLPSGYGAIRLLACWIQQGHSKFKHWLSLISRSRIPISIDSTISTICSCVQGPMNRGGKKMAT